MSDILVPLSPGELLDKITILRIKCARIEDASKLANVRSELSRLEQVRAASLPADAAVAALEAELERINSRLWDIEDRIREHEASLQDDVRHVGAEDGAMSVRMETLASGWQRVDQHVELVGRGVDPVGHLARPVVPQQIAGDVGVGDGGRPVEGRPR